VTLSVVSLIVFPVYEGKHTNLTIEELREIGSVNREQSIIAENQARQRADEIRKQSANKQNLAILVRGHLLEKINLYSLFFLVGCLIYFVVKSRPDKPFLGGVILSWGIFLFLFL
jgi:hypothetical protein